MSRIGIKEVKQMRLVDADKFKEYILKGWEDTKSEFKTEKFYDLAKTITYEFLKDIDEQPTACCENCKFSINGWGCMGDPEIIPYPICNEFEWSENEKR